MAAARNPAAPAMDLQVLGWQYTNIRGGLRDVTIDLGASTPRWTLIQMPNGTGKTTTMALLRAVLAGEALTPEAVRDFRPADDVLTGAFELRLAVAGRVHRLQLRLNYEDGTASYWTSRADLASGGLEEGRLLPDDLARLITPDFARLFVFDGELAKQIRDPSKQQAAQTIRTLYRLDRLDALVQQIERLVNDERRRAEGVSRAETTQGLKLREGKLNTARETHAALQQQQRTLSARIKAAQERQRLVQSRMQERMQQDEGMRTRVQHLTDERQTNERAILDLAKRTLVALRNPAFVHPRLLQRLRALGGKLHHLKLPQTMSAEFFKELAEQDTCVCGRTLGAAERRAIAERAGQYLAEDQIAVINAMKLAVRHSEADPDALTTNAAALKDLLRARQRLNQQWDQLEAERLESGDYELEALRQEHRELEAQLVRDGEALDRITTKDKSAQRRYGVDWKTNLPLCVAQVKEQEEALHTVANTLRFLKQARLTEHAITAVGRAAFERLCERVRRSTNDKLRQLVPGETLEIVRIGGALELAATGLASKSAVSEGQSLAVAYAFLTSLFQDAPYRLPFIVDSPAVSLDVRVRREVGELIPDLFGQMIMFVISSEREGFADAFYGRPGVRYLTLWKREDNTTAVSDALEVFRHFHTAEDRGAMGAAAPVNGLPHTLAGTPAATGGTR